ncbi:MAG: hypothetical protein HXM72_01620 [Mogibacterium diversum]|nr:hypothetical protein [Mogibacterium diversum]
MKVLIISGFLGAGKTTFIKAMSNILNRDFVILENEYASLNIDEDILKEESELSVWELTELYMLHWKDRFCFEHPYNCEFHCTRISHR